VTISSHLVRLEDGRFLSWCELGAPSSARVLVVNHGPGSSRLEMAFHDTLLEQLDLRVLAPERPGYGLSTALERGRSVADWTGDVAQLLTATGVDEIEVAGYSEGGPHALALAASPRLAARIRHVTLVASLAPDLPRPSPFDLAVQERVRLLAWRDFERSYRSRLEQMLSRLAPSDEAAFADAAFMGAAVAATTEGARQGARGEAADDWATMTPWGLDLGAIAAPVDIWHGTADQVVPVDHAFGLRELIRGSRLHLLPGEGHFSIAACVAEALGELGVPHRANQPPA
jgi:pimeloyl-ACP methyl ester carboxylesterase